MSMHVPERQWHRVASGWLVYFGLGVASAILSNPLQPGLGQTSTRVSIFLVAIAVFYFHFRVELERTGESPRVSALLASVAVGCGTFLLAVYAVGMAWWESSRVGASLLAALIVWPVATGIPAFLVALGLGQVVVRGRKKRKVL